ncbi:MAG: hypothetical protein II735_02685, partial [Clostridia bacterium]|nr:hypothetical protein [Clostridia bacterium]
LRNIILFLMLRFSSTFNPKNRHNFYILNGFFTIFFHSPKRRILFLYTKSASFLHPLEQTSFLKNGDRYQTFDKKACLSAAVLFQENSRIPFRVSGWRISV